MAKTEFNRLVKELREVGFEQIKTRGGHLQFKHPFTQRKISLTCNVKKNIELSVRRQIKENERFLNENQ